LGSFRLLAAGLFAIAELIALGSLAGRGYHAIRSGFILIAIAVGLFLVLAAVAPPYRDIANRRGYSSATTSTTPTEPER
jgi:hypothetical protein